MPELPEVVVVSKFLQKEIVGQTIKDVKICYPRMMDNQTKEKLINQQIQGIQTFGKYIVINLTDYDLISHLRMEGKYFIRSSEKTTKHDHLVFYLTDKILMYNDVRKFGTFDLREKTQTFIVPPLSKLGKEPFDLKIKSFYQELKKRNVPLKSLLLNQEIVAGIGNIYADEILFQSRVHPLKKGVDITKKEAEKIILSSIDILTRAINKGGTTIASFKSDGHTGWFSQDLMVHTRYGEKCKICGTIIEKTKIGGRTSYYCKSCQKE